MVIEYAKYFLAVLGLRKEWAEKNNGAKLFFLNDLWRFIKPHTNNLKKHLAEFVSHVRVETETVALTFGGGRERGDIGYVSKNVVQVVSGFCIDILCDLRIQVSNTQLLGNSLFSNFFDLLENVLSFGSGSKCICGDLVGFGKRIERILNVLLVGSDSCLRCFFKLTLQHLPEYLRAFCRNVRAHLPQSNSPSRIGAIIYGEFLNDLIERLLSECIPVCRNSSVVGHK